MTGCPAFAGHDDRERGGRGQHERREAGGRERPPHRRAGRRGRHRASPGGLDRLRDLLGLAFIVFLQFFTRYVLNDSLAWTEEIARYGLMWIMFIGGAMVTRRNTHIAVELLSNVMKPGPLRAALLAARRFRQARLSRPARLFLGDDHRAHGHPAHDGVRPADELRLRRASRFGCFLMFVRQALNVWRNARDGWRRPHDITHQIRGGLRTRS